MFLCTLVNFLSRQMDAVISPAPELRDARLPSTPPHPLHIPERFPHSSFSSDQAVSLLSPISLPSPPTAVLDHPLSSLSNLTSHGTSNTAFHNNPDSSPHHSPSSSVPHNNLNSTAHNLSNSVPHNISNSTPHNPNTLPNTDSLGTSNTESYNILSSSTPHTHNPSSSSAPHNTTLLSPPNNLTNWDSASKLREKLEVISADVLSSVDRRDYRYSCKHMK